MRKARVICVDDEPRSANLLKSLCERINSIGEVFVFTSSPEALEFATHNKIDIAFLDVDMPQIDGIMLAESLRKIYPRLNIIMTTAYAQYAVRAIRLDCSGYLLKPFSQDDIEHQMQVLRFPIEDECENDVVIRCFGNFEVFCNGKAILFAHSKTLELLAYLVDRNGSRCTNAQILTALWEDDKNHTEYLKILKRDLLDTLSVLGVPDIVASARGQLRLRREKAKCDYFDYLDGKDNSLFKGEYMEQYSWAEDSKATLFFSV